MASVSLLIMPYSNQLDKKTLAVFSPSMHGLHASSLPDLDAILPMKIYISQKVGNLDQKNASNVQGSKRSALPKGSMKDTETSSPTWEFVGGGPTHP